MAGVGTTNVEEFEERQRERERVSRGTGETLLSFAIASWWDFVDYSRGYANLSCKWRRYSSCCGGLAFVDFLLYDVRREGNVGETRSW